MNSRVTALAALLLLMLVGASSAQDKSQVICKGASVPEGFVVSGETVSGNCRRQLWAFPRDGYEGAGR